MFRIYFFVICVILIKIVEGRQSQYYYPFRKYAPNYYHKKYTFAPHGPYKDYYPQNYPYPNTQPDYPDPSSGSIQESVMYKLATIAENDSLQCVPKLICEITSNMITGRQTQGLNLPLNVNMESLLGLLTLVRGTSSPILYFGKAALLGVSAKNNLRSCEEAYPNCPSDPDKLIYYLNNHNGGFFRYFNGIGIPSQTQSSLFRSDASNEITAEKRIQNSPVSYYRQEKGLTFPNNFNDISNDDTRNSFAFPLNDENNFYIRPSFYENPYRSPKELRPESIYFQNNDLDFQRPLPNHVANPNIFPDRTGTGEFKLDQNDIDQQYYQSITAENQFGQSFRNDKKISFPNY